MSENIKIRPAGGIWTVRAAGSVMGETKAALELIEDGYMPVIYFPQSDIAMALLDTSDKTTHCPHKGDASYFSVHTKNGPIEDIAWCYATPLATVGDIEGHIAFAPHEKITVEQV